MSLGHSVAFPKQLAIRLQIAPPVDLIFERTSLSGGKLCAVLRAHGQLDVTRVGLALRVVPGRAPRDRLQVADKVRWSKLADGVQEGLLEIDVDHASSVLTMLSVGETAIRRQWINDPRQGPSPRYAASVAFDVDLRMMKAGLFELQDSTKFERAVGELMYLLGFSTSAPLETDAPDLIVTTPGGRLAVVECTTRVSDVNAKVGKLVRRRSALVKALKAANAPTDVTSIFVCRAPRDQIALDEPSIQRHQLIVLTAETLRRALLITQFPRDADQLLQNSFDLEVLSS